MHTYSVAFYYSIFIYTLAKEINKIFILFSYKHSVNKNLLFHLPEYTYKVSTHITIHLALQITVFSYLNPCVNNTYMHVVLP
jgi:hypothetical protein